MPFESKSGVDEAVTPSRRARAWSEGESDAEWPRKKRRNVRHDDVQPDPQISESSAFDATKSSTRGTGPTEIKKLPTLKRAHAISFAGLLLFTTVTYFRPYELIQALAGFRSMAFWLAVATLVVFIPTQFTAEGNLTARPLEVNLALLLALAGVLSVPFALDPSEAWAIFLDFAKVIAMFIVMVNVVRTERRWRWMVWLSMLVGVVLSVYALNDYLLGNFNIRGVRIEGILRKGLFENPNDMALHLVTMIPIALGLLFVARSYSRKLIYGLVAALMVGATLVTFSRGGFLALMFGGFVVAWKLGRRNRFAIVVCFLMVGAVLVLLMPSEFTTRLVSVFGGEADGGSASTRQNLLLRSLLVTLTHPLLGVGMGNFHGVSISEQVSHNAYTQVSAEMGVPALIIYIVFMWSALRRMRRIERETYDSRARAPVYYVAVGLQAALVGYMVSSFFASVAYLWYIYYLVGFAVCLHRLYESKGAEGVFGRVDGSRRWSALDESKDVLAAPIPGSLVVHHER